MRHTNLKTYQAQQLRKFSTRRHRRLVNDSATLYQALRSKEFESHSAKYVSNSTVSDAQDKGPHNIAVIGGGITGLTSAFYLSQELPNANITIYEGSERLGGWLRSKHVNTGNGDIVFEQGPRTLRPGTPAGLVVLNLIKKLGLENDMIITNKNSKAAQNRFVYYPDHLVTMPHPSAGILGNVYNLLTEPVFTGLARAMWGESDRPQRPSSLEDESVGSFLSRRLGGSSIPDNLVSAVLHGIYAGDIYKLSVKSLAPKMWYWEGSYGSLLRGLLADMQTRVNTTLYRDLELNRQMLEQPKDLARESELGMASVYSFKQGIGQLSDTVVKHLQDNPRIEVKTGHEISRIAFDGESKSVKVSTVGSEAPVRYDSVLSTISGKKLATLASAPLPSLASTHAVTVMVVNLYYSNPDLLSVHGFGYLLPRSIPYEQNPEFALGVVFDSCASIGQDSAHGTKLTVMLGGHWWDDFATYPDEEQGTRMARAVLSRHLKIDIEPDFVHVGLQSECIPQYTVGHEARMAGAHRELIQGFKGKLAVAGNSYTGVGLNDCVRAARDVVLDIAEYEGEDGITGLEQFTVEQKWVKHPRG